MWSRSDNVDNVQPSANLALANTFREAAHLKMIN